MPALCCARLNPIPADPTVRQLVPAIVIRAQKPGCNTSVALLASSTSSQLLYDQ